MATPGASASANATRLTAVDYAVLSEQAAMQKAQAVLVDRCRPKAEELLLGCSDIAHELAEWELGFDAAALYTSLGLAVTPPHQTARIALDRVISEPHCKALRAAADAAMSGTPARGGHCNVAVGAVGCVAAAQRRDGTTAVLNCHGEVLSRLMIYKTRLQIMEYYGEPELFESGSVITRISCAPGYADNDQVDYACLHVDKANIGSYDYSALLYLSEYGVDFQGGKFAFCHDDVVKLVEPRMGRLVAFTSGPENLHQVRPVTRGARYVLAMWFTKDRSLGLEVNPHAPASTAPMIQVSTLGRQKEIQNVLTSMRRDIEEVLQGIRKANFDKPPTGAPAQDLRYASSDQHEHIIGVLRKFHDKPPVQEMRLALFSASHHRDGAHTELDEEQARDILFFPREEHMLHYVTILKKMGKEMGTSCPDARAVKGTAEDRCQRVNALFLNVFVLWHSRHWILARAFMVCGGLQALLKMQGPHLDAQIRWNAVEVLARLLIEHPDGWEFDWMDALETCGRDDRDDHVLHRSLYSFALQTPSPLLQALLISPPPAAACPGGRLTCLRIVSFWLSWLRLLYCPTKPQGFRMSKIYMDEIESLIINGDDAQERKLAQRLFDDFGRFPPADDGAEIMGLVLDGACLATSAPESAAAPVSQRQPSNGTDLKDQGNAAFKNGDYQTAEQLFSRAILADHRQEAYFANRSAARLALEKYAEALQDTEICLDLSGGKSFKAWYRKGQALEGLLRTAEAIEAYTAGIRLVPSSSQLKQALDRLTATPSAQNSQALGDSGGEEGCEHQAGAVSASTLSSDLTYTIDESSDAITVVVQLGRDSMQGVDLQVFRFFLRLTIEPHPALQVDFPFAINEEQSKAKLVKRTGILKVVAPRLASVRPDG